MADKKKSVVIEGKEVVDPSLPTRAARTPRDVAFNKSKTGEEVALDSSKPDHSTRFFVTRKVAAAGRFIDGDGNEWTLTGKRRDRTTILSRSAILKDGGDPSLLNIPETGEDKFEMTGPVGNAITTHNGVLNTETGEMTLPEEEEDREELVDVAPDAETKAEPHVPASKRKRGAAKKKK